MVRGARIGREATHISTFFSSECLAAVLVAAIGIDGKPWLDKRLWVDGRRLAQADGSAKMARNINGDLLLRYSPHPQASAWRALSTD